MKKFLLALPAFVAVMASPSSAQLSVLSEWETAIGNGTLKVTTGPDRASPWIETYFRSPESDSRLGWRNVHFDGKKTWNHWGGNWHMPNDRTPTVYMRRCASASTRRGGDPRYDATHYWGYFSVKFNSAETEFGGRYVPCETYESFCRRERCDNADYNTRYNTPRPSAFDGRRVGTPPPDEPARPTAILDRTALFCSEQEYLRRDVRWVSANPNRPEVGEDTEMEATTRDDYRITPCYIDALRFDRFKVEKLGTNLPGDFGDQPRPAQVYLQAVDLLRLGTGHTGTGRAAWFLRKNIFFTVPLKFRQPVVGQTWDNLIMSGRFCSSEYWLVSLRMHNGKLTGPVTVMKSGCGRGDPART